MPKQILLADDSVTIHRVIQITFAKEDVVITAVKNADDALARARELKPDVVLADAGMAGKSGYDLCAALRAEASLAATPCLILTGNFSPYDDAKGQKAGVDGHLVKPFETQALIDRVNELISKKGGARPQAATVIAAAPPRLPVPTAPAPAHTPPPAPKPVVAAPEPEMEIAVEAPAPRPAPAPAPAPVAAPKPVAPAPPPAPRPPSPPPAMTAKTTSAAATMMMEAPKLPTPTAVSTSAPAVPTAPQVASSPVIATTTPTVMAPAPARPAPAPAPAAAAPRSMPMNVPQMPRPSLIPHAPTPTPAPTLHVATPRPNAPPRATLMGIPAVNPAMLGNAPAQAKPVAAWAPPAPARAEPAASPAAVPRADSRDDHSPLVAAVAQQAAGRVSEAAIAQGADHDVVVRMSREIIERIAWEVVPELSETIIREQLARDRQK